MKLRTKIMLWTMLILLISISVTTVLSMVMIVRNTESSVGKNLMNVGEVVAKAPTVIKELKSPPQNGNIQELTSSLLKSTVGVDLVVVCNMQGIRYSHPNPALIGAHIVGGDETPVIESGKKYISVATGTLGTSFRAFVPVFDNYHKQVGFVLVGVLYTSMQRSQRQLLIISFLFLIIGLIAGCVGAVFLAHNIKRSLLGLEPEELVGLYREHCSMLEAIQEGIIVVDRQGNISLINAAASNLLGKESDKLKGVYVQKVMPTTCLPEILSSGKSEYNQEQWINGKVVITNRVPIIKNDKVIGAVATFRDRTLITKQAEELTGVKQIMEALRSNTHEFKNKLYVILGLLEFGKIDEAKKYIMDIGNEQSGLNQQLVYNFKDSIIAGLLLGKINSAKEQNVSVEISPDSFLDVINDNILSHSLVKVIGNLIDNAIESAKNKPEDKGFVRVYVFQGSENISISVKDNGPGITPENLLHIFERNFSTKGENRGIGLSLVAQTIKTMGGKISVESHPNIATVFEVQMPIHVKGST